MQNIDQLKAQRDALSAQIDQAVQAQRAEAIQQAKKIIADFGLNARELGLSATASSPRKSGDARASVAPKFRDPQNPENTWTGRGKQPRWLASAIAAGKSKASFLI
jgi:DNA-binding protein H-NS